MLANSPAPSAPHDYASDSSDGWDTSDDEDDAGGSNATSPGPQDRAPDMNAQRTIEFESVQKSKHSLTFDNTTLTNNQTIVYRDEPHRRQFPTLVLPPQPYDWIYVGMCLDHPNTDNIQVPLPEPNQKKQPGITHNGTGMWINTKVFTGNAIAFKKKTTKSQSSGEHRGFNLGQPYEQATFPAKPEFIIFTCPYHNNAFVMEHMAKTTSFLCMSKRPERFLTKGKRRRNNTQQNYNVDTDITNAKHTLETARAESAQLDIFISGAEVVFNKLRQSLTHVEDPVMKCAIGYAVKKRKVTSSASL